MDQLSTTIGISCLAGNQAKSLVEWNAQYEANDIRQDWWFKAAAAVVRMVRLVLKALAIQPTTALQLAHG